MEIRGMRWGYAGDGVGCGPVEGDSLVEICLTKDGKNYFVLNTRIDVFEHIYISEMPLFDVFKHMHYFSVEFENEYEKITRNAFEEYEFENGEPNEEIKSEFKKAIQLVRLAMHRYYDEGIDEDNEDEEAADFIAEYTDGDFDEMDLPEMD